MIRSDNETVAAAAASIGPFVRLSPNVQMAFVNRTRATKLPTSVGRLGGRAGLAVG
jgi:hypothetical protein